VSYITPSTYVDFAGAIDTVEDQLAEQFDLTDEQARKIACWHRDQLESNSESNNGKTLRLIAGELLERGNIKVKTLGLIFAAGLNTYNGWKSEREAARMTGFTPAAINQSKDFWIQLLGIPRQNCKSEAAREKYRANGINNHWRNRHTTQPSK